MKYFLICVALFIVPVVGCKDDRSLKSPVIIINLDATPLAGQGAADAPDGQGTPVGGYVEIQVESDQPAEAWVFWGHDPSDASKPKSGLAPTPAVFAFLLNEVCVWGLEVDLQVAKEVNSGMPWYNTCQNNYCAPSWDTVRVLVDGDEVTPEIVHHAWETGGNLFLAPAMFECTGQ